MMAFLSSYVPPQRIEPSTGKPYGSYAFALAPPDTVWGRRSLEELLPCAVHWRPVSVNVVERNTSLQVYANFQLKYV
jgi:hypothetical protein